MSRPVDVQDAARYQRLLREYSTVFVMFYTHGDVSGQSFLPTFESLCAEHSTPDIAFLKVEKVDVPDLRLEHEISRDKSLVFIVFKHNRLVASMTSRDSRDLVQFVDKYADPELRQVDIRPRRGSSCYASSHTASYSPPARTIARPRSRDTRRRQPSPSPRYVPVEVRMPRHRYRQSHRRGHGHGSNHGNESTQTHLPDNYSIPARMIYRQHYGFFTVERPALLEYLGRADGRRRRTDDVRVQQGSDGRLEATYLDRSGPIAIERIIGE